MFGILDVSPLNVPAAVHKIKFVAISFNTPQDFIHIQNLHMNFLSPTDFSEEKTEGKVRAKERVGAGHRWAWKTLERGKKPSAVAHACNPIGRPRREDRFRPRVRDQPG